MIRLALAFTILVALPAAAETLRPYTPGGAPCAGACSYAWARERFGVPVGEPHRLTIPQGSVVSQMSYAKHGVPYTFAERAMLAEDEPGQGYMFEVEGVPYMMVQLDACANWAVMQPPASGSILGEDGGQGVAGTDIASLAKSLFASPAGYGANGIVPAIGSAPLAPATPLFDRVGPSAKPPVAPVASLGVQSAIPQSAIRKSALRKPAIPQPEPLPLPLPSPVPLPASIWLLALALGGLGALKHRKEVVLIVEDRSVAFCAGDSKGNVKLNSTPLPAVPR